MAETIARYFSSVVLKIGDENPQRMVEDFRVLRQLDGTVDACITVMSNLR